MDVWWIVAISIVIVLVSILVFRLHAFLTLLLAGLLVAGLSSESALQGYAAGQVDDNKMTPAAAETFVESSAPTRLTSAFGETVGKIGILIALASIIGQCLLESGAARTIVDRMLKLTGPKRAPEALAASSFLLGIPVFFDTVFYLMIPLARSLRERVGKNYVLFILAILAGGSIAHSLVPPTPGPLIVADTLGIDIGVMLIAGLTVGSCSSVVALMIARVINYFVDVPLRFNGETDASGDKTSDNTTPETNTPDNTTPDTNTSSDITPDPATETQPDTLELSSSASENDHLPIDDGTIPRPALIESLLPIVIPVVLITIGSVLAYLVKAQTVESTAIIRFFRMLGDKNIAIAFGVVFAMTLVRFCDKQSRKTLVGRSLASAGNIILITAAGGAFGAMLRQAGIAGAVSEMTSETSGLMLLPLAFVVTAAIRTLQGSATVAMITAAGVLQPFAMAEGLPFHPVYIAMAIGAGSKPVSWMTDSAFWVITRMSGMTEAEGLKVISPMSIGMGFSALGFSMLFAWFFPAV